MNIVHIYSIKAVVHLWLLYKLLSLEPADFSDGLYLYYFATKSQKCFFDYLFQILTTSHDFLLWYSYIFCEENIQTKGQSLKWDTIMGLKIIFFKII